MDAPEPIDFAPQELFFSTTDSRGVIEKANGVFVRLSQYPWQELVGAPHNVIRHDDMPGGAFKLMWQTLQAHEPFCAYVVNESADGRPYTVFATITPLGDGYLSVRSRPMAVELRDTAFALYSRTRAVERELRQQGMPGPAVATRGLEELARLLGEAGVPSYTDFILAALPAEVAARAEVVGPIPTRGGDGPLHELLDQVGEIDHQLSDWTLQMDRLAELTTSLQAGAAGLRELTAASSATAEQVSAAAGDGAAPIMLAVNVWASMMPEVEQAIDDLLASLAELATSSARTRFHIALARLHNDATAQFVVELIDGAGQEAQGSGTDAISDLARALDEGMAHTAEQGRRNAELAASVATQIDTVRDLMLVPQGLLGNWQQMASERSDDQAGALVPVMAGQIEDGDRSSALLQSLAAQCREQAVPLDVSGIEAELVEVRRLVRSIDEAPAAPSEPDPSAMPSRRASRAMPVEDDEDDTPVVVSRRASRAMPAVDDDDDQETPVQVPSGPRRGA